VGFGAGQNVSQNRPEVLGLVWQFIRMMISPNSTRPEMKYLRLLGRRDPSLEMMCTICTPVQTRAFKTHVNVVEISENIVCSPPFWILP
jgi:hypothetical protein